MSTKHPSVRAMLARTTPNPPYASLPERYELLAAMREIRRLGETGSAAVWNIPRDILQREEVAQAWIARRSALQAATASHYKTKPGTRNEAQACHCASCERWRAELRAMHADKAEKEPSRD
jgi:hypothetical protein